MISRVLHLTLVLALVQIAAVPVAAQQLVMLPSGSWATDITPDGEVVVGTWNYADGFLWRWREEPAPTVILGGTIEAVSDDGTVVAGNIFDSGIGAQVAARWTAATGWVSLGWLPNALSCPSRSTAYDMSGDGSTVVGLSWVGCNARGFRWTAATGMQELQSLANGNNRCSAISDDGSTLGGFAQGNFDRTPAYWAPDTSGATLNPALLGEVAGFNSNGAMSVGTVSFSGVNYLRAFLRNQQTGAITNLGSLHFNWASGAEDISEDGRTIVGFDYISLAREAWVWTSTDGMISMNDRLLALGITDAPPLLVCRAVSDDGNVVVGGGAGVNPFDSVGFIVELDSGASPWVSVGPGLAGTSGVPVLGATGGLGAGQPTSVTLTNGKPNGSATFVVGLSAIQAPFKQGVLVPNPDYLLAGLPIAPSGATALQFNWPAGVPSGTQLVWQAWFADAGAPAGFAATNGLQSTTP